MFNALKPTLNFHVVSSLNTFANIMAMKLCKGSLAPHIPYPEGQKSVMEMSDAEVMMELQQMSLPDQEDSQDRDTVEDEFPSISMAMDDPYL